MLCLDELGNFRGYWQWISLMEVFIHMKLEESVVDLYMNFWVVNLP